jgi:hypothetical protein
MTVKVSAVRPAHVCGSKQFLNDHKLRYRFETQNFKIDRGIPRPAKISEGCEPENGPPYDPGCLLKRSHKR